jgi:ATP-dependent Clp endopeptidase proteolytic subunit ClpP
MSRIYWSDKKTKKKGEEEEEQDGPTPIFLMGPSEDCNSGGQSVEVIDNAILFYGEVTENNAKLLNKAIRSLDRDLRGFSIKYGCESPPIKLHISSYGGSVFAGLSVADTIKLCETPIHTYIDGKAASAATLISICGSKRYMTENAFILIHQLSSGMWGKYEELLDEVKNLDLIMKKIKKLYQQHTSISPKKLEEMLKHDLWLEAGECVKLGLVDEII